MKRVLVTSLDWGLGHATRCIPIIKVLLSHDCKVYIGSSGAALRLLQDEFPQLNFITLPAYNPVYPSSGAMVSKMLLQLPKFYKAIKAEHQAIAHIIDTHKIDLIISDNRYGCWSDKIPSIFITHQTNISLPKSYRWLSPFVQAINKKLILNFDTCWIPDIEGEDNLSGELTSCKALGSEFPVRHIGSLSRFTWKENITFDFDVALILSGPEPQRSILEQIVMPQLEKSGLRYMAVRGLVGGKKTIYNNVVDFLSTKALQQVINKSKIIIARSGYSSVMDFNVMCKQVIFIPTPGQTEQVYLAERLMKKGIALCVPQNNVNLQEAIKASAHYSGFTAIRQSSNLQEALYEALNQKPVTENI